MDENMDILIKCSLFSGLSDGQIRGELLRYGVHRLIPKGKFLLQFQERLDHFGIILRGSVRTMHIFSDGSFSIMDVLKAGEVYGADLICTKSRISPYFAMAAEETELLIFPARIITGAGYLPEELRRHILDRLLVLLAQSNMKKEYRLAILSRKGLRDRILTYLTMQAAKRHTNRFEIPFDREEMASFLCVNRSALSHELSRMRGEGILSFRKNVFTIHDEKMG